WDSGPKIRFCPCGNLGKFSSSATPKFFLSVLKLPALPAIILLKYYSPQVSGCFASRNTYATTKRVAWHPGAAVRDDLVDWCHWAGLGNGSCAVDRRRYAGSHPCARWGNPRTCAGDTQDH